MLSRSVFRSRRCSPSAARRSRNPLTPASRFHPSMNRGPSMGHSACMTARRCSVASKSTRKSARPVTASTAPPFPNEEAARTANGGTLPPDLSLIVKARDGGSDYVYSIVVGDGMTPPHGFKVIEGKYFDSYFPGRNISMPPPLADNSVTYSDGTNATKAQEAHDVVTV